MTRVERFTGSADEWDAFVRTREQWTHCHLFGWRSLVEDVSGHECVYLATRNGWGELTGVLPLVHVRSLLFGGYLVSMPYLNYGGPLGDPEAVSALVARAVQEAAARNVRLLELRNRYALPVALSVSHRKITAVLEMPDDGPEALWTSFSARLRSQVRRPVKEGVTVRFGQDQIEPFHEVFARHMRDLGTPAQPLRLFERIAELFPEDVWFGCAYLGDAPIAGGCGFQWAGEFEMSWASALLEHKRLSANMLLYWSFMERACRSRLRLFNFGRCTPGSGTHRFKAQWGARDEPLWWYAQSEVPGRITPSPTDGAYSLGPRLWRHLPLGMATALGPRIVRGIP